MNVSFTGINNVKIFTKSNPIDKNSMDVFIDCDLSNDRNGMDLADFKETLKKCRPCYQINCINKQSPQNIKLISQTRSFRNELRTSFKINNYDIMLDERQILPLYSFMARLTKKISENLDLSELKRYCAKFVNCSIGYEAERFINKL